ncbi:MAG TPA: peptide deformylase [Bacteroidales bacterium]|jgi:peptide deformylase|nr:peptide deformylase [Bacteroidales bacterium]HNZ43803.1 peptide deformylase [Bacteroidales bacterium]HOH84404.1 peptide deformylase [Bacteroidales bacterium]HPB26466.1 peptide deformylase [Bacteroidales bacterium]HPI29659.1 peptide deformylase [Bacteroidales bacterium]
MKLPIIAYGTPLLKKKSIDIDDTFPDLKKLIADMYETMYASVGVGLAAPQVGLNIRLLVVDTNPYAEDYPEGKSFKKVFINPQIIEFSGKEWSFNEGCLSVPEIREDVVRHETIKIEYYDENFNFFSEEYSGIISRVIQHEYDHLEGVLFVDRLSSLKKMVLKRKLTDISKGLVKTKYKMIFPLQKKHV